MFGRTAHDDAATLLCALSTLPMMSIFRRWPPHRVFVRGLLLALLIAYGRWLFPHLAPYAGGADSAGYLWSAHLITERRIAEPIQRPPGAPVRLGPGVFAPLGTIVHANQRDLVPTYPSGLPLLLSVGLRLAPGERGIAVVLETIALLTLWATYRLGRAAGLERLWAATGAALLGASPLFVFMAVQVMSDVASTMLAVALVLLAWRSRRRPWSAAWAGAVLGMATLVRPTSVLLAVPLLAATGLQWNRAWRIVLGGAPFALFLFVYQSLAYGGPLSSGYGDMRSAFSVAHVGPTLRHYATWFPPLLSWVVLVSPAAWIAWTRTERPWRLITAAWLAAVLGLYAFYVHTAETWWYLRFVLPACPPLIVAGLRGAQWTLGRLTGRLPMQVGTVLATACLVAAGWTSVRALFRHPLAAVYEAANLNEREYRDALKWFALHGHAERPALMVQLGGAARVYVPDVLTMRFDRLSADDWREVRAWQQASNITIDAAVLPFEEAELLANSPDGRLGCAWRLRDAYRQVRFWECPP